MRKRTKLVIIPARLESTRFPNKLFQKIDGKTLLQHSYESAKKSKLADDVIITTSNEEILVIASDFGAEVIFVRGDFKNGTERVARTVEILDFNEEDTIVNCQADTFGEDVGMVIDDLIEEVQINKVGMFTPTMLLKPQDFVNNNVVKVNNNNNTFSRKIEYKKHIGIYAAKKKYFSTYLKKPETYLEVEQRLEQLRFFLFTTISFKEYNKFLKVHDINVPEDILVYNHYKKIKASGVSGT